MEDLELISLVLTTLIGLVVGGLYRSLHSFIIEQREVNKANEHANRALQKAQLIALFHKVVELGEEVTLEEFNAGKDCFEAYEANHGNGVGVEMWKRIKDNARIRTGL